MPLSPMLPPSSWVGVQNCVTWIREANLVRVFFYSNRTSFNFSFVACLAIRLGLEFDSMTRAAKEREHEQVEAHMRVCLTVHGGFETVVTASPSEPILAEAARYLIKKSGLDLPSSLLMELKGRGIKKSYRGELVMVLLMIMAVDIASELHPTPPTPSTTAFAPKDTVVDAVDEPRARPLLQILQALLADKWLKVLEASKPTKLRTKAEGQRTLLLPSAHLRYISITSSRSMTHVSSTANCCGC